MTDTTTEGWMPWGGGECPLASGLALEIRVRLRDGSVKKGPPERFSWGHTGHNAFWEIVAYRIVSPAVPDLVAAAVEAEPLKWRKPTDHPRDPEDAMWVADGIVGQYSIYPKGDGSFILWGAHDEFVWEPCASVAEAKAKAEANWQSRFAGCIRARSQGERK